MELSLTKKDLAEIAGRDQRRVAEIDKGLPEESKLFVAGKNGKYDLATFVQRWTDFNIRKARTSPERNKDTALTLSKKELAALTGYTYQRIYEIDNSLPDGSKLYVKSEDGKCDLAFFMQRWVDYKVEEATPDGLDLDIVKAKHEAVKVQKTKLEVAKMRGQMIDIQDVRKMWGDIATTVSKRFTLLPRKIAPLLLMIDSIDVIKNILDSEIRKILEELAGLPVPDYVDTDKTDGGEDGEEDGGDDPD